MNITRHPVAFEPISIFLGPADVAFFERVVSEGSQKGAPIPESLKSLQSDEIVIKTQDELNGVVSLLALVRGSTTSVSLSGNAWPVIQALLACTSQVNGSSTVVTIAGPSKEFGLFGSTP